MSDELEKTAATAEENIKTEAIDVAEAAATDAETAEVPAAEKAEGNGSEYILEVEGLKKYFPIGGAVWGKPKAYLKAVDDVSFKVKPGTTIGVVGESGCGKTTLGRTILKLYDPNGGKILFKGEDLTHLKKKEMRKYRTRIQLIFQDPYSSLPPRMTVGSIIAEAVRIHNIVPKDEVYEYVQSIMEKCGLQPQFYDRYPHEFSGGQRQRICIARALAVKPELVICDEPVSALDVSIQAQIINLLKDLQNTMNLTYVFISHDLSVVKYITDRILVMYLGNVMELGDTAEIFANPLHPYTQALFSAVPVPDPDVKMNRIILEGDIPSPANPPRGCKFHTRCSKCMDVCKFKEPEYVQVESKDGSEHRVACHLYNEEVMNNLDGYAAEYAALVEKEAAEAERERIKKEKSVVYKIKKFAIAAKDKLFKRKHGEQPETDPFAAEQPKTADAEKPETTAVTAAPDETKPDMLGGDTKPDVTETLAEPETSAVAETAAVNESASNEAVAEAAAVPADNAEHAGSEKAPEETAEPEVKPKAKKTTAKPKTTTAAKPKAASTAKTTTAKSKAASTAKSTTAKSKAASTAKSTTAKSKAASTAKTDEAQPAEVKDDV